MLRHDLHDLFENGKAGDWCFEHNPETIVIIFGPDPFYDIVICPINDPSRISWDWNGDKEHPTLSPSIRIMGKYTGGADRWHGFLENGVLRSV